ncbi:MAG: hypothetical protein CM15mP64_5110 [Candidatus Neomarinimicrobiota bacterium]|nr:MAG: hypothetical protein CM15mP64_5110 [Candidatus Neomarinimicrobiota bacterium]
MWEIVFFLFNYIRLQNSCRLRLYVDGVDINSFYNAEIDSVDPSIVADRIIVNKINTSMGLTMERRVYASASNTMIIILLRSIHLLIRVIRTGMMRSS